MERHFGRSSAYSLGIEEEFQIVDESSLELVPKVDDIVARIRVPPGEHVSRELFQSVVETSTGVTSCVSEAVEELTDLRVRLRDVAARDGLLIAAAGTHPFSRTEEQAVTVRPRYIGIQESMRWVTERGLVFGLHVHVGVDSAAKAVACANGIRNVLAELLALSANSPFWAGRDTGLASARTEVFDGFPRSGIPPALGSFEEFESQVERGMKAHSFPDYTYVWWDVRPHPRLGTVEVRICDVQTRLSSVASVAALVQALVATFGAVYDGGRQIPAQPALLLEDNKWRATRDGLDATLIDLELDSERPARAALQALVELAEPAARRLGCAAELAGVDAVLARGGGADEQRLVHERSSSLVAVARWVAEETVRLDKL